MKQENLAYIIDLILHHASPGELEMIQKALDKRQGLGGMKGPQSMAQAMAQSMAGQLGLTEDRIRNMTRDMIAKLVRQKEPGYSEEQVREAVEYFINPPKAQQSGSIAPKIIASMVADFVEYSQGRMTPSRQLELRDQLGSDWPKEFFKKFPPKIRLVVKDHLEAQIGQGEFWEIVEELLGINID